MLCGDLNGRAIQKRGDIRIPDPLCYTAEKNRTGKTRDLFKKIRDIKGTFLAKMGSIKDRSRRY